MISKYLKPGLLILATLFILHACKHKKNLSPAEKALQTEKEIDSLVKQANDTTLLSLTDPDYKRIADLGGLFLIKYDYAKKCNLTIGYYYLNKAVKDSGDLSFIAKFLATRLFKNHHNVPNCNNPPAAQVLIYKNVNDFKTDDSKWIISCGISADDPDGLIMFPN